MESPQGSYRAAVVKLDYKNTGRRISGVAVPFNVFTEIRDHRGHYQERFTPGAFTDALATRKPRMLFEHGEDPRTGATPIGSWERVWQQDDGLHVEGELFDNSLTAPLIDAARSGELEELSVHFRVKNPDTDESWTREKGWQLRTVNKAMLPEISLVNFGAYPTVVNVRRSVDELALFTGQPSVSVGAVISPTSQENGASQTDLEREARHRLLQIKGIIK